MPSVKPHGFALKYKFFADYSERFNNIADYGLSGLLMPLGLIVMNLYVGLYGSSNILPFCLGIIYITANYQWNDDMFVRTTKMAVNWHSELSRYTKFVAKSNQHNEYTVVTEKVDKTNILSEDELETSDFIDLHDQYSSQDPSYYKELGSKLKQDQEKINSKHFKDRTLAIANAIIFVLRLYFCDKEPRFAWLVGTYDVAFLPCRPFDVPEWTALSICTQGVGGFLVLWFKHGLIQEAFCCLFVMILFGHMLNMLGFVLLRKYSILDSLSSELKKANEVKSMFVSNVSHEFRSPLLSITGSTELLKDSQLTDEQKQSLDIIDGCSTILLKLIDDILMFSKLSYDTDMRKEIKDVSTFGFRECINHVKSIADSYSKRWGVKVDVEMEEGIPDAIRGDTIRLQQILLNVLNNAAKYTPKDGTVRLIVNKVLRNEHDYSDEKSIHLKFQVIDKGPGIPEKKKKLLFQPFSKLDSPSHEKKVASTGLGLAITRKMVIALGGTISFTSSTDEDKHGTVFTILLPFEYDDTSATELQLLNPKLLSLSNSHHITDSMSSPLESFVDQRIDFCSVVIAEDNTINATIIARLLRQSKDLTFSITTVGNGKELVDTMNNWKGALPNIILTDLHMPIMDGITAATIVREKYPSIKIALLTGETQELKISDKIIDKVLLKPITGDKLRKCVKDLLNSE